MPWVLMYVCYLVSVGYGGGGGDGEGLWARMWFLGDVQCSADGGKACSMAKFVPLSTFISNLPFAMWQKIEQLCKLVEKLGRSNHFLVLNLI